LIFFILFSFFKKKDPFFPKDVVLQKKKKRFLWAPEFSLFYLFIRF